MKKYSIIYADPPWAYRTYSKKGQGRSAESHYPTMCIEDIKALPVGELRYEGDVAHINNGEIGEVTHKLYNTLTGIQWGKLPDELGWTVKVD